MENNIDADKEEAKFSFLRSYDFMKLGQAINHQNWQVAR